MKLKCSFLYSDRKLSFLTLFSLPKAPNLAELCNPITRQVIELSKPSTDSARLAVKIEKNKFLVFGGRISKGDVIKKGCFGNFGRLWLALDPNPLTHSFGSKFC